MGSVFENASTRMFCVSGELSDLFCMPGGIVYNFDELLCARLMELGYDSVVFCSTQRNIFYALNAAGSNSFDILKGKEKKDNKAEQTQAEPNAAMSDYGDLFGDVFDEPMHEEDSEPEQASQKPKTGYICRADMRSLGLYANRFMHSTDGAKALVFTSLEDVIKLSSQDSGRKLLECFEEWKGLPDDNRNICIFLSKTLDSLGLQDMLRTNRCAVLESLFLKNAEFNNNACLSIGAPMGDEIGALLEILRLEGREYTDADGRKKRVFLRFDRSEHTQLVRALSFCNRESGFTQIKIMKERLEKFMISAGEEYAVLTLKDVMGLYPQSVSKFSDEDAPMEILKNRKGWESAYHVLNSFVSNYRTYFRPEAVEEKQQVQSRSVVDRFEPGSRAGDVRGKVPNFVLQGPPGVGKTEIAGLIGKILQREGVLKSGHTVIGSRDKLVGEYVGSTAIKTAALIGEAQEGVLLVDEVYSIAEKREGGASFCGEVFNTIVAAMTNSNYHFCVIFAGYADRMHEVWEMNEGLLSRFSASNIITLNEYEPELLQQIFMSQFGTPEGTGEVTSVLSESVVNGLPVFFENYFSDRDRKNFGNARDVKNLVSEVKRSASYRHLLELEKRTDEVSREERMTIVVEREDFEEKRSLFDKRGFSAEDIYSRIYEYEGLEFLVDMFNDQLAIKVECREKGLPYPGPSHMIWAGNPGTGKSTAAQLTADLYHTLGILGGKEPIYVDASELTSKYVSESAGNIQKKMDEACQKNAVLVIEEAYQLLEAGGKDAIHAMLNRMETDRAKFNIILILYKDKVEPFLNENPGLRSRLKTYYFPDYDPKQLFNIFKLMCDKSKDKFTDECAAAVKDILEKLYNEGKTSKGNARTVRQMHEQMNQLRYRRVLREMAVSRYGDDSTESMNKIAADRAMGRIVLPENAYVFTEEDVREWLKSIQE